MSNRRRSLASPIDSMRGEIDPATRRMAHVAIPHILYRSDRSQLRRQEEPVGLDERFVGHFATTNLRIREASKAEQRTTKRLCIRPRDALHKLCMKSHPQSTDEPIKIWDPHLLKCRLEK